MKKTTRSAHTMHRLGYGECKGDDCERYGHTRRQVPARLWVPGDGRWECPECGYGIAPDEVEYDAEDLKPQKA